VILFVATLGGHGPFAFRAISRASEFETGRRRADAIILECEGTGLRLGSNGSKGEKKADTDREETLDVHVLPPKRVIPRNPGDQIPLDIILVAMSLRMRLKLKESPLCVAGYRKKFGQDER